jgi:hypothetical protein
MKAFVPFLLLTVVVLSPLKAQDTDTKTAGIESIRKNSLYFEILGNGVVYSINFERIIFTREKTALFLRIGGNEYHGSSADTLSFNFIAAAGILYGGPWHYIEPGIGFTYFSGFPDRLVVMSTGYRYQGRSGFTFRSTPMYIINSEKEDSFGNSLWIGLSVGYSF